MSGIYLDTSALAKWYLPEAGSAEVEAYLQRAGPVHISSLTRVELRCLLARRRRNHEIDDSFEGAAFATFEQDIHRGHLMLHPLVEGHATAATLLLELTSTPLRTLDALHLAIARELGLNTLATADQIMADAAEELGLAVMRFGWSSPSTP